MVAVSGGPDSVALLRGLVALATERGGHLMVAHFNHGLRGGESNGDEQFVAELAVQLGLPCELGHRDLGAEAAPRSAAAARELRYRYLRTAADRSAARYLVTAHTADDQAETVLHRIVRGTGLAGLRGIPARRRLSETTTLVRPFLGVTRAMILEYLAYLEQPFRDDSSNRSLRSTRGRVRHDVLPRLRELNPQVSDALVRLSRQAVETQHWLAGVASAACESAVSQASPDVIELDCRRLAELPRVVARECLSQAWRAANWPEGAMGHFEWEALLAMILEFQDTLPRRDFPGAVDVQRIGTTLRLTKRNKGA